MYKFLTLFFIFFISFTATTQTIYWADEVVSFSSEWSDVHYSSEQVLGVPNAISPVDLSPWAWVPKKDDGGHEYIKVKFKNGVKGVRQVFVSESFNPGAISKIAFFDTNGKKHTVYENKNPKPIGVHQRFRMFKHTFSPTDYYVKECMVELKTKAVPGSNHIDAIGISDQRGEVKIKKQINLLQYKEEVPEPENLGRQINSKYAERLPIISPDGNTLFFVRKFHPENLGGEGKDDIWVSYRTPDDKWSYAQNIGEPLNNETHNFVIAINPTGTNVYLGNDYRNRGFKDAVSVSSPSRGSWKKPELLKIEDHYNDNEFVEYHVSVDEKILLMAVERKEGYGERDLYVCFKKGDGSWTKPRNLGRDINTVNIESSVFLAADGKTIYFSSNGHYNYGGLDVFVSRRLDDSWTKWSKPQNLGPKINSEDNDFNYTIPASGEYAYFSSGDNSYGMSDLFRIRLPKEAKPEPVMLVTGKIIDASTNKPIKAKVKYNPINDNDDIDNITEAKEDGSYQVVLPYGDDIEVYADIEGYFPISENMELSGETLEELDSDNPNDVSLEYEDTPPSEEEKKLEADLKRLEAELAELKKKKENKPEIQPSYEETPLEENKNDYAYENPTSQPSSKPNYDPELEALKKKYYQEMEAENNPTTTSPSDPPKKNTSTPPKNTYNKDEEKPSKNSPNKDGELDDLYDKFNSYKNEDEELPQNDKVEENTTPNETPKEETPKEKPKPNNPPSKDGELDDLADKLNNYEKEEEPTTKPTDPFYVDENKEKESSPSKENSKPKEEPSKDPFYVEESPQKENDSKEEKEEPIKENTPSFEEIEARVRIELKKELTEQIKAELRKELMDEIKAELEKESPTEDSEKIIEDVVVEVEKKNRMELDKIPLTKASIDSENTPIELELKELIIAEVKEELKEELEEPIKEELKEEVTILVKEKEKDQTQKKMEEWKKRRQQSTSKPRPTPQPQPKKDPEYVELNQNIQVVPIKVGQVIPMNNIFFDANKSSLKDESFAELKRVLDFLQKNSNLIVEVGGHTNGWCSSEFASELSRDRAKEVRAYFVKNGISENRIEYRGYGKTVPIASNDTLAGRKKNQRVELKILEIKD